MPSNPGGYIDPKDVIGRDELIANLWEILARQSLILSAERRADAHWKKILTNAIADLVENQERQVIFFWDEMPYMLDNLGSKAAMEVLDTLRSLRQTYPTVRMVYTGSIGLHHVVDSLKQQGHSNAPTNDMYTAHVNPLTAEYDKQLAIKLLKEENIVSSNLAQTATEIAEAVDRIPFYIHDLIAQLKQEKAEISREKITEMVRDSINNPRRRWDMDHYRSRINTYYEESKKSYALKILDFLAVSQKSVSFADILCHCQTDPKTQDRDLLLDVLTLLQLDYYLVESEANRFQFRLNLVQLYWRLSRRLDA